MMQKTKTRIDHDTFTITFERVFDAARDDVFDAWTDPAQVTEWWDPTGTPLAACAIDLRVGGSFLFTNASSHGPAFSGVYRVIERPTELAFDAMGALGTVKLGAEGEATRMVVTIRCASKEHLEQYVKLGVDVGTDQTLDNLGAFVGKLRKAS